MVELLLFMILLCLMFGGNNVRKYSIKLAKIAAWLAVALLVLGVVILVGSRFETWISQPAVAEFVQAIGLFIAVAVLYCLFFYVLHNCLIKSSEYCKRKISSAYSSLHSNHRPLANIIHNLIALLGVAFKSFYALFAAFFVLSLDAILLFFLIRKNTLSPIGTYACYIAASTVLIVTLIFLWKNIKHRSSLAGFRKLN